MRVVLMPGLDGTGALFEPFLAAKPLSVETAAFSLPHAPSDHAALARTLAARIDRAGESVLLAESFSGPIALSLAATLRPKAIVLVNSFIRAPVAQWFCRLLPPLIFAVRPPDVILRTVLLGGTADTALLDLFRVNLSDVPADVLTARVRAIGALRASPPPATLPCALAYLRGADDRLVTERSVDEVCAHFLEVEVLRIPGPHLLLQAEPERAWAALWPFLSRVATT